MACTVCFVVICEFKMYLIHPTRCDVSLLINVLNCISILVLCILFIFHYVIMFISFSLGLSNVVSMMCG